MNTTETISLAIGIAWILPLVLAAAFIWSDRPSKR